MTATPADSSAERIAWLGALFLVGAVSIVSRGLTHISAPRERLVASFAGGVSLAFVFLELFVELANGATQELHDVVRAGPGPIQTIAILVLAGTVLAFAAEIYTERHVECWRTYGVALAPRIAYGALVGAALVEELRENRRAFGVFWLAMLLHLGISEHRVTVGFPREHRGGWRVVAVGAPFVGATVWMLAEPPVAIFHLLLALVAGATILSIFREELPSARDIHARAFFTGVTLFGILIQARWWL
jgi:hypothetical protein